MKYLIVLTMILFVVCVINNVALLVAYLRLDKKLAKYGESKFYDEVVDEVNKDKKIGF